MHVSWVDGQVYVSPNMNGPPPVPTADLALQFCDPPSSIESLALRHSSNKYPFLGFTIANLRYSHVLLRRLNHSFNTLPIVFRHGEWALADDVVRQWEDLEHCLIMISNHLFNHFQTMLPADVSFFPFPSSFGFARGRPYENQMRRAVMKARAAFGPLLVLCSYMIALTPSFTANNPPWLQSLSDEKGNIRLPHAWVEDFAASPVADFSTCNTRIGVVMTPSCQFFEYLPKFLRANVPVWILWNQSNWYSTVPGVLRYRPAMDQVRLAHRSACVSLEDRNGDNGQELKLADDMGESPERFFERRNKINRQFMPTETQEVREARSAREAEAMEHRVPEVSGARVFVWKIKGSRWFRCLLDWEDICVIWPNIRNDQRRYDSFANEWDIYAITDPSPVELSHSDNSCPVDQSSMEESVAAPLNAVILGNRLPIRAVDYTRDLGEAYNHTSSVNNPVEIDNLYTIIRYRLGFQPSSQVFGSGSSPDPRVSTWKQARTVLGDVSSVCDNPEMQDAVVRFVNHGLLKSVPSGFWDFAKDSKHVIVPENDYLRVVRVKNRDLSYYELIPKTTKTSVSVPAWRLMLHDPLTALECVRRSNRSISKTDYALFLIKSGRSFNTRLTVHRPPPSLIPAARSLYSQGGLGSHPFNYCPSDIDYLAYEAKRDVLLHSERMRAAVMKGGIVWRLSVHSVSPNLVCSGPVDFSSGSYLRLDGEPYGSWDDEVSDDDLDLICGVYKVFTGTSN
ncbi:hypothetical protein HWV62_18064 [Athelia sp. TMB]|nr:hypothetical protein HWV62_18064 [Athelia sp. TMB]